MAYHELLKPSTFRYCCRRVWAAVDIQDEEEVEHLIVGGLASILRNLINKPDSYTFDSREAVRRFLQGAIHNWCSKLVEKLKKADKTGPLYEALDTCVGQQQELISMEIDELLAVLAPEHRSVFKLFVRGYQYAEIAEMLQIKEGTVKSRLHKARKLLQSAYKQNGERSDNAHQGSREGHRRKTG